MDMNKQNNISFDHVSYFDTNFENWRSDINQFKELISSLVSSNKIDELQFLTANPNLSIFCCVNYQLNYYIGYYSGFHNNETPIIEKLTNDFVAVLLGAARNGNLVMANYALYRCFNHDSDIKLSIFKFIIVDFDEHINSDAMIFLLEFAAKEAAKGGHLNIIKFIEELIPVELDRRNLIDCARKYNNANVIEYLNSTGITA